MSQTIDQVYSDFNVQGVPASGEKKPSKAEIRALLKMIQNSGGQAVTRNTLSSLNGVTPPNEDFMGVVLNDPDPTKNGYYYRDSAAWVKGRGLPDSIAEVTLAGTANAQTGTASGINPADVVTFFAVVGTENTGSMTLSIAGETARNVVNSAGNALSAGEWTGAVLFFLNGDGDYQLMINPGAEVAAAQSATDAQTAQAAAELAADRAENRLKANVRVATTAAATLATDFENGDTIDGVVLVTGDRILIKDQAAPAENGIYVVAVSGAPTRATDFDSDAEVDAGCIIYIEEGSANGGSHWQLTTPDPITIGTTGLSFASLGGSSLPSGGTAGQALIKQSGTAGDADWEALLSSIINHTRDGGTTYRSIFSILNNLKANPLDYDVGGVVNVDTPTARDDNKAAWDAMIAAGDLDILLPRGIIYMPDDPELTMPPGLQVTGRGKRYTGIHDASEGSGIIANGDIFKDTNMNSSPREFRNFFIRNGSGTKGRLFDFGITTTGGQALAGVLFEDVYLANAAYGIYSGGAGAYAVSWRLSRLAFEGMTNRGMYVGGSSNFKIGDTLFVECANSTILLGNEAGHQDFKCVDVTFDTNPGTAMTIDANNTIVDTVLFEHCYFEGNGYSAGQPDIFASTFGSAAIRSIFLGDSVFRNVSGNPQTAHVNWTGAATERVIGGPGLRVESTVPLAPNDARVSIFDTGLVPTTSGSSWKKLTFA